MTNEFEQTEPHAMMIRSTLEDGGQNFKQYVSGRLTVFVVQEPVDHAGGSDLRWHMSISHPFRHPTWDEIGRARDLLLPDDVFLMMPHPPRKYWLNRHPHCFHLWEFKDQNLIDQFAYEGEIARQLDHGDPS